MHQELEEQFREFARTQAPGLRRFAYLLCADWHLAEDLVQAAMIKMYRAWPRIRDRRTVGQYARKTLVRCWLDERRRPWRRGEHHATEVPDIADPSADPNEHTDRISQRSVVLRAMTELAPKQRAVLVLRYFDDLSISDTAAVMKCSEGNVKSQSARGLANLREVLARMQSTPAIAGMENAS